MKTGNHQLTTDCSKFCSALWRFSENWINEMKPLGCITHMSLHFLSQFVVSMKEVKWRGSCCLFWQKKKRHLRSCQEFHLVVVVSCGELLPQLAAARVDPHLTVALDRNSLPPYNRKRTFSKFPAAAFLAPGQCAYRCTAAASGNW